MKIELSRSSKDIILACKEYYSSSETETIVEKFQRVISYINGESPEMVTMNTINWWLSQVYEELLDIPEAQISRNEMLKFIRGESVYQNEQYGYSELGASFWFLRDNIQSCRCKNSKKSYELVLDINLELDTEYARNKREEIIKSNAKFSKLN